MTKIVNVRTTGAWFISASIANTFRSRLAGLLGRQSLPDNTGLILERCNAVHTIGMRFPIDVIFLNADRCVMSITSDLKPGRFARCQGANAVLECNAGVAASYGLSPGDALYW